MKPEQPHRQALIASLRTRFAVAVRNQDALAKQSLFKEAVYLGIQPELLEIPGEIELDAG